ncbi:MAG: CheR family methyltransferase [Oligoflexus sp.]
MEIKSSIDDLQEIEVHLLLEAIRLRYGYDFSQYASSSLRRRLEGALARFKVESVADLIPLILRSKEIFQNFLSFFTVTTSEMFRDPPFYQALVAKVFPLLETYQNIKIWHAGCSTGEEVYSMAILLQEEGLLEHATIYATDINPIALDIARNGIYKISNMQTYTNNYQKAGRLGEFSSYYSANYGHAMMNRELKRKVVFSEHNLATDSVFSEVDLIICRNVLIYFNRDLQNRVFQLFWESLSNQGHLCLGSKESLRFCTVADRFTEVDRDARIYRKLR